jgi:hypothetical protein
MALPTIIKEFLPGVLARDGTIGGASGAAYHTRRHQSSPRAPLVISEVQMPPIEGVLALEHADRGLWAYNLWPGFIASERMVQDVGAFGFDS